MTAVRLRNTMSGESHVLGDVPFGRIDSVILALKHWGLDNNGEFVDTDGICGQFKFDENGAYFLVDFE